jgi:hypothetical protein
LITVNNMNLIAYGKAFLDGLCPPPRKIRREPLPTGYGTDEGEKVVKKTLRAMDIREAKSKKLDFEQPDPSRFRQLSEKMLDPKEVYFPRTLISQGEDDNVFKQENGDQKGLVSLNSKVNQSGLSKPGDSNREELSSNELQNEEFQGAMSWTAGNDYFGKYQLGISAIRERSCEDTVQDNRLYLSKKGGSSKRSNGGSKSGKCEEENSHRKQRILEDNYYTGEENERFKANAESEEGIEVGYRSYEKQEGISEKKLKIITGAKKQPPLQISGQSIQTNSLDHLGRSVNGPVPFDGHWKVPFSLTLRTAEASTAKGGKSQR